MDDLDESQADRLWVEEVVRRARPIDDGSVSLVALIDLEQRVQARLEWLLNSNQGQHWSTRK